MRPGERDVLLERGHESAVLVDALAGAGEGGTLVVVEGAPGIG